MLDLWVNKERQPWLETGRNLDLGSQLGVLGYGQHQEELELVLLRTYGSPGDSQTLPETFIGSTALQPNRAGRRHLCCYVTRSVISSAENSPSHTIHSSHASGVPSPASCRPGALCMSPIGFRARHISPYMLTCGTAWTKDVFSLISLLSWTNLHSPSKPAGPDPGDGMSGKVPTHDRQRQYRERA